MPILTLGDSKSVWSGIPLPLDLSILAVPGCRLYTNPLVAVTSNACEIRFGSK